MGRRPWTVRLYVVHNSHPCVAVAKALELKRIDYSVWEWPPPLHPVGQTLLFGGRTVPAVSFGRGDRVQGSRAIMHRLDELVPEPALYPDDPELRARVEEADRWGDEQLQQIPRDLLWAGLVHSPGALATYGEGSLVPLPPGAIRLIAPGVVRAQRALNRTGDAKARARLAALPVMFDRIDEWIADGTLGDDEHPNAADLQILSSVRLLYTVADVRPMLNDRPCLAAAQALWPPAPGRLPEGALRV